MNKLTVFAVHAMLAKFTFVISCRVWLYDLSFASEGDRKSRLNACSRRRHDVELSE
jgi:hypothetical protein